MIKSLHTPTRPTRRLGVAEAKAKLSEILRQAEEGPTIIHSRGKDLAVVLAIDEYERLVKGERSGGGGSEFLRRIEAVKQRHGGGVDFEPPRLDFTPWDPFARKSKGRA